MTADEQRRADEVVREPDGLPEEGERTASTDPDQAEDEEERKPIPLPPVPPSPS